MKLSELLERAGLHRPGGQPGEDGVDPDIRGLADDSRRVRVGDLFVAFRGHTVDGAGFIESALEKGAVAVVAEIAADDPLLEVNIPIIGVDDARAAASRLAAAFHDHPARDLDVVGITGTNGKTTTTFLLRSIFESAGIETGILGTIRYLTGSQDRPAPMTTPDAIRLQSYLAEMRSAGCRAAVLEVSSHALSQRRTTGVDFDVAVFTNLSPEHLDYHVTIEEYAETKAKIFAGLAPGATAVVNADSPWSRTMLRAVPAGVRVLRFGLEESDVDVRAQVLSESARGSRILLETPRGAVAISTGLIGRHNVENVLAAASAALARNVSLASIARGIHQLEGVPGRLETVSTRADVRIVVDYAHTPDGMDRVLSAVRPLVDGRLVVMFGCGGDRDRSKRPLMGVAAERWADRLVITDDNPRGEEPAAIRREIIEGLSRPEAVLEVPDRTQAIEAAVAGARPGDWVVLLGKGHETEQIVGGRRQIHDDRVVGHEAARELSEIAS